MVYVLFVQHITGRTARVLITFQWCWRAAANSFSQPNAHGTQHFHQTSQGQAFRSHSKNEQESSCNLKKGNLICYLKEVKSYLPKTDKEDISTQHTTSEYFHTDAHEEDSVVNGLLQTYQHYSLLLLCCMQHISYRYKCFWWRSVLKLLL